MPRRPISPVDVAFRREWPTIVSTLVRETGDLELAEDATSDAFVEATRRWHADIPERPGAWLMTTARRKAIDRIRRQGRFDERLPALAAAADRAAEPTDLIGDDQLALIFGCCHPSLNTDAQVALTLRAVGGLTTAQIARAFIVPTATMARRLGRAKAKIRAAGVPFAVPDRTRLAERVGAVCAVIYAIFTEGHASATGVDLVRGDLCDEAIFLGELLSELLPDEPEVRGLVALCLLTDARRATRTDPDGLPILLADQDRSQWDRAKIRRGLRHLDISQQQQGSGPYRLQAVIAAIHATAPSYAATEWPAIVAVYDMLREQGGGPVIELNRAAAIAERDGADAALTLLEALTRDHDLDDYHYLHSARAELLRRLERLDETDQAYRLAIEHCSNEAERTWLERRSATLR